MVVRATKMVQKRALSIFPKEKPLSISGSKLLFYGVTLLGPITVLEDIVINEMHVNSQNDEDGMKRA